MTDEEKIAKLTEGLTEAQAEDVAREFHEGGEMAAEALAQKYRKLL